MKTYPTAIGELALRDVFVPDHVDVLSSSLTFHSPIFDVYDDEVVFPFGDSARRQYMKHADAVGIVAVRPSGDTWEVLLIHQYRHAPRLMMWEVPAGLCDIEGEDRRSAAMRELAEETGYTADNWQELVRIHASAGVSDEAVTLFLARGISQLSDVDFDRIEEEREITVHWIAMSDVIDAIYRGDLTSPALVTGILAAQRLLDE
ncbi:NUDIX domain-containing protein [Arcanobacterium pinnipediorum]|uniref:NUDIX hydrolase n=1 Tax=Arcanobacterium pinnipediorum TaxID=1503041 RepID=A0ABY5AG62_9ACTO|nr:NUDIX hydrolase [Arcanobacterium pinnipediorum]USR78701.1 NUDIX hydrolase [Arcanobacterium pinnipediorum]